MAELDEPVRAHEPVAEQRHELGAAGEWLVRRTPSAVAWEHRHGEADVAVRGPALDLLLVLNRRATPGDTALEVAGDERLLAHWLEHSVFA